MRVTRSARTSALAMAAHINNSETLVMRAQPDSTLLAFGARDEKRHDVFALADALLQRGWYFDRQGPPSTLHLTVHAGHETTYENFLRDLNECLPVLESGSGSAGSYATVD
jgi:glutamate/tyrosine decarboxylase-like PLP-dependent enzyme